MPSEKNEELDTKTELWGNLFFCLLVSLPIGYFYYKIYVNDNAAAGLITIPIILGIIVEHKRLLTNWMDIFVSILLGFLLSLFTFIPSRNEEAYVFQEHLEFWPFWFVLFFTFVSIFIDEKKVTAQLTEGVTLLQSISIVYWLIDINALNHEDPSYFLFALISGCFVAFSFFHAFTYHKLTKRTRFWLSIWSSIIMIIFAGEYISNIFRTSEYGEYEILNVMLIILPFFLLGISLMYMLRNIMMLVEYLPGRSRFYGKDHMMGIRAMNKAHIERYSKEQIKIIDAFIALVVTSSIYYWNYTFQVMPRGTMIWLVFWIFPFVILLKERIYK